MKNLYKNKSYWLYRLRHTRVEEFNWIAKRALRLDHTSTSFYSTPANWQHNFDQTKKVARIIRGENYSPSIFIHGVLPRSGTNIISDIIETAKNTSNRGDTPSEFPFLSSARAFEGLYSGILAKHRQNEQFFSGLELMAYSCSGIVKRLQDKLGDDVTPVFKMPSVYHIELFPILFPLDKLVVVVRDGRDIIQSSLDTWRGSGRRLFLRSGDGFAKEWALSIDILSSIQEYAESNPDFSLHVLKYEDFISNPSKSINDLFDYLGLEVNNEDMERVLNMPLRGSSQYKNDGQPTWEPIKQPDAFSPVGRWKNWSIKEKKNFNKIAGKQLIKMGYEETSNWCNV